MFIQTTKISLSIIVLMGTFLLPIFAQEANQSQTIDQPLGEQLSELKDLAETNPFVINAKCPPNAQSLSECEVIIYEVTK